MSQNWFSCWESWLKILAHVVRDYKVKQCDFIIDTAVVLICYLCATGHYKAVFRRWDQGKKLKLPIMISDTFIICMVQKLTQRISFNDDDDNRNANNILNYDKIINNSMKKNGNF